MIAYDLAVLGNAGLEKLEKWFPRDTSQATESIFDIRGNRRDGNRHSPSKSQKYGGPHNKEIRYYKLNGARVKTSE